MRGVGGHSRYFVTVSFFAKDRKISLFRHPPYPPPGGGTPRTTKILGKGDLCHSKDLKNAKMGAFDRGGGGVGGSPPVAISGMPTHAPQSTGIFGRLLTHYINYLLSAS